MPEEQEKVFKVLVQVSDRSALIQLLREHQLDLNCGGPQRQEDSTFTVEAYVTAEVLDRLRQSNCNIRAIEDVTEVFQQRQREVSRGNRFAGNRSILRGLGKKE